MTAPGQALAWFLSALAIGAAMGLVYGFLEQPRRRWPHLCDALFLPVMLAGWVYLTFGICGGDSRLGYSLGLLLGAWGWQAAPGRLLRPVFSRFWAGIGRIFSFFFRFLQKIFGIFHIFFKKLLATGKKSVMIVGTRPFKGGAAHGTQARPEAGSAQGQPRHKGRHRGRRRPFHLRSGGPEGLH